MSNEGKQDSGTVKKDTSTFFVGSYSDTGPYVPEARGIGVSMCVLNLESGTIEKRGECTEAKNSTYLEKSPDGEYVFVAADMFDDEGEVQVFSLESGELSLVSSQSSHGQSTCHVSCDLKGEMVFVSSYQDGKLTTHKFNGEEIFPASRIISYTGSGPNAERQEAAHAHQAVVSPNNKWLYVCDLGSDKIWIHEPDKLSEDKKSWKSVDVPPGYGPRHLVWNAQLPIAYVLCELNSHILVYEWDELDGEMDLIEDIDALPNEYTGVAAGAAIRFHPTNKTLFISDRGQNSIVVHSINESDGRLTYEEWFSTRGKAPRDFNIDPTGKWLLAANQDTHTIVPFQLDSRTGLPTGKAGQIFETGTPVCILFK